TWSEVLTAHLPPPRWTPLLAFDDQEEGVLLFGGYAYTLGFLGDTWVYAKGDWSQVGAGSAPPARDKGMMAYDAWDQRMVLFAGEFCLLSCSTGGYVRHLNDTWSFENGTWKNISGSRNPPQQCCGAMTFDWGSGQLVVLSANSSGGRNATTWVGSLSPPSTGGPEISSLRAWPSSPTVGSGVLLTVAARPSLGTLTYLYTSLPPGCATLDSPLLACAPRQPGSYVVSVEVTDASGRTVAGTLALTVTLGGASPPPPSPVPGYLTWVVAGGMVFSAVVVLLWVRAGRKRTTGAPSPREPPDSTRGASEAKEPIVPEHTLDKGSTTLRHGPEDPRSPEPSSTEEVAGPRDPPQGREASAPVEAGRPPTE
ncbi:MAG: hypothetical protein KGI89_00910, partial [Euryarchaeota archaeon]|nr:hypothetical protein [Euryarchaeota archaeon]